MQKQFRKITFKNGLRLIIVPQSQSLAASVLVLVEAGSEYESKRLNGISHFLEHLMFKGTELRPKAGTIAEELAALGARFNAFTSQEYTGYWAKAEAHKLPQIFNIVSDLYLNPIFDPAEIEKERGVIIEEINMRADDPTQKAPRLLMSLMFGDQPAGWEVAGPKENIRKIKREEIMRYRKAHYIAQKTVVVISGKCDPGKVIASVEKVFGWLPRRRRIAKYKTKRISQSAPRIRVEYKDSGQSHLAIGFCAFDMFDRRRYALEVLADILGGGMSSRLFKKVREEMGAAYYVGADADLFIDHGLLGIYAGVDHGKVNPVLEAILGECNKLKGELVPEHELQRAKDHMTGGLILGLETADELGGFYGGQEILTRKALSPEQLIDRIQRVTAGDIRNAARAVFTEEHLNVVAVGPHKKESSFKKILAV